MLRESLLHDAGGLVTFLREHLPALAPYVLAGPELSARAAAVLVPLYSIDGEPFLLFTRRSTDLAKHKGEISFPGGSRDPEDVTLTTTALREAREEIGLDPAGVEILGALPPVFVSVSNFVITPQVGWLGQDLPALVVNPAEVAELIQAPLAALAEPEIYHTEVWSFFTSAHTVHFFEFGPYLIWGATARMLFSLLSLLPPLKAYPDNMNLPYNS
ncbi:MAG: NUDIX hydrolase [Ktedonobacterales bacterium]